MIRYILAIAWKDLLIVLKDKGVLAVYFLMPILFASLLGSVFGNAGSEERQLEVGVLVVNQDGGDFGQMVVDGLKTADVLTVEELAGADEADQRVAEGEVPAALVIPANFSQQIDAGQPVAVSIIKDPTQQEAANIVAGIAGQAMAEIDLLGELRYGIREVLAQTPDYDQAPPELIRAVEAQTLGVMWTQVQQMRQNPVIAVEDEPVQGAEESEPWDPITYYIPGFSVAFAFFLVGQMAETLLRDKEEGTFRRLLSSPMPRASIIGGSMLAYGIIVFLQVLVLFTVGYVVFKMPLGESPLALVLMTAALCLASSSMGMMVGALVHSRQQAERVGQVLGFILLALGGTIMPLFRQEGFIGILSRLTPNAWGIEGYMGLVSDNWTLAQTLPNILVLLGFGIVFFAIALWRFRYDDA